MSAAAIQGSEGNRSNFQHASSPPRKAVTALVFYWTSQNCCHSLFWLKAQASVESCLGLKGGMKRYLERPKVCGKTGQLPPVVSRFCSRSACRKQGRLHKKLQRPTDHTSYPLMEVEPVQSADLCFQCNQLQWLTYTKGHLSMAYAKKVGRVKPSP